MEIILAAIPLFFLLIAIELIVDKKRGTGFYRFNDTINSLNLGVMSRLTEIFKLLLPLSVYVWIYQNFALWHLPDNNIAVWIFAFIVYDLGYYWVHRLSHEIAVMWGSHVVHHSSEEYNLTTALRQTGTPAIFAWIVFLPMAFIGIPPAILLAVGALNLIYQFWVHTRHIHKLPGWYENLFVTPSHHRVHHALNKEYIDKNYGGVFIFWDKYFGSFAPEKADIEIVYGVCDQLNSWDPIWANLKVYKNLFVDAWHSKNLKDKIKTFLMPPGWRAENVHNTLPRKYANSTDLVKYDVSLTASGKGYLVAQFTLMISMVFALLLMVPGMSLVMNICLALFAIFHCWVISTLQENKPYAGRLEVLRILSTSFLLTWLVLPQVTNPLMLTFMFFLAIVTVASLLWFMKIRGHFQPKQGSDAVDIPQA